MPTKIEWADEAWNPIAGCTKCSPGCLNCYAERMACRQSAMERKREPFQPFYDRVVDGGKWVGNVICNEKKLEIPLHWRNPRRIFPCSMSDLFHPKVPLSYICKILSVTYQCRQHTFLFLTKRIERIAKIGNWDTPSNVHLGVSISNQAEADEKIPILLQIPAAVRWLSIEPMLENIDLHISDSRTDILWRRTHGGAYERQFLDWIVVGGESGPGARPMHPDWPRNIRDQCVVAGVPFFMKQMGGYPNKRSKLEDIPEDLRIRELPNV